MVASFLQGLANSFYTGLVRFGPLQKATIAANDIIHAVLCHLMESWRYVRYGSGIKNISTYLQKQRQLDCPRATGQSDSRLPAFPPNLLVARMAS
jgi:hypothetical protein